MSIYLVEFSALALAHFIALLSPGPDFILVVGCSFQHGWRKTLWVCLGIAIANSIYILLAIGGFSLLRESTLIFWVMKLSAAGYLFYLGTQLIKSSQRVVLRSEGAEKIELSVADTQLFIRGFLSAMLNPKNAIFYLSLMALIVSRQTPITVQMIYGLWMFGMVLCWDILVCWCIGNPWLRDIFNQQILLIERISGLLLMFVGVFIVLK